MSQNKTVSLYPFEFRVLQCLTRQPFFIKPLNVAAKLQHSPMAVKNLREKGISIISEYKENPDTEAITRRKVVEYSLAMESKQLAMDSLTEHLGR